MRRGSVLLHAPTAAFQAPGGGENQLIRTAWHLEALGVPTRPFSPWLDRLEAAADVQADHHALRAEILKVPHHASKHGVTLGLVELVQPSVTLVSSVGGGGKYNFPHLVALEAIREARQPVYHVTVARRLAG
jgi:hypothetical protein